MGWSDIYVITPDGTVTFGTINTTFLRRTPVKQATRGSHQGVHISVVGFRTGAMTLMMISDACTVGEADGGAHLVVRDQLMREREGVLREVEKVDRIKRKHYHELQRRSSTSDNNESTCVPRVIALHCSALRRIREEQLLGTTPRSTLDSCRSAPLKHFARAHTWATPPLRMV